MNLRYLGGVEPLNLYRRTTCLLKVQGSLARTRFAFASSSNTNKRTWSPASRTLKSFLALHRDFNVRPMASMLRALLVRNFAANTYSLFRRFLDLDRLSLTSSSSVNETFFQSYRISSKGV